MRSQEAAYVGVKGRSFDGMHVGQWCDALGVADLVEKLRKETTVSE